MIALVDCRPSDAFAPGHVPGARHLDPEGDLTGEIGDVGRGRHPLPDLDALTAAFRRAGIGADSFVLAYDEGGGWAARCWWLLRHLGHDAAGTLDIRSYAGPLEAGTRSGAAPEARELSIVARERTNDVIEAEEIHDRLGDPSLLLLDARSEERWLGDAEPLDPVAGRIPGARNAYFEQPLPDDVLDAPEIAVYCGSGVSACVTLRRLVLEGRDDVRLYPGSFSEWCRRDGYPIEKGRP